MPPSPAPSTASARRAAALAAALVLAGLAGLAGTALAPPGVAAGDGPSLGSRPALAQGEPPTVFVNTTEDLEIEPGQCVVDEEAGTVAPCPLRAAFELASAAGGVVRARWCEDASEGEPCLGEEDPNHDPATGRWRFPIATDFAHVVTGTGITVDFAADVPGWSGPADNRVLIDTDGRLQEWVLAVEARRFLLRGFDLSGTVEVAALTLRLDAHEGRIEGLAIYDVDGGPGYHLRDDETADNVLVGSWCGVKGDGTEPGPVEGPCVQLERGATRNRVGGPAPGEGNVLCHASVGVHVTSAEARANRIEGNQIGVDDTGRSCGLGEGVRVDDEAPETAVVGNVIAGADAHGVIVEGFTFLTLVEGNRIGLLADGTPLGNGGVGVRITNLVKRTSVQSNTIAHNAQGGVRVSGVGALQNLVRGNRIYGHGGHARAILVDGGSNGGLDPPVFSTGDGRLVNGRACSQCVVELFSDPDGEARVVEGTVVASSSGIFRFEKPEGFTHGQLTATATDPEAGTSPLSRPFRYRDDPTPTATAGPGPTATPPVGSPPPGTLRVGALLPWLGRGATR